MISSAFKIVRYFIYKIKMINYGRVVIKDIKGIKYELDLSENIDSALYHYSVYERATSKALNRYIKPDMTVIEVGANMGAHTFEIAKLLNAGKGRLYSFEPTDYAFRKLKRNHELNGFTNVVLEKTALSDNNEERDIYRASSPETMPFKASWDLKTGHAKYTSVDRIRFEKLDHYVCRNSIDKIDLLKIDVDGYELKVIRGGIDSIEKYRPVMIIELGITIERVGDKLEDLIELLSSKGYFFCSIESHIKYDHGELINVVREKGTVDCLCLPSELY